VLALCLTAHVIDHHVACALLAALGKLSLQEARAVQQVIALVDDRRQLRGSVTPTKHLLVEIR
jgi:hypothetical protein